LQFSTKKLSRCQTLIKKIRNYQIPAPRFSESFLLLFAKTTATINIILSNKLGEIIIYLIPNHTQCLYKGKFRPNLEKKSNNYGELNRQWKYPQSILTLRLTLINYANCKNRFLCSVILDCNFADLISRKPGNRSREQSARSGEKTNFTQPRGTDKQRMLCMRMLENQKHQGYLVLHAKSV